MCFMYYFDHVLIDILRAVFTFMNESEFVEILACVRNTEVLWQLYCVCGLGSDTETSTQPSPVCVYVPHMNL